MGWYSTGPRLKEADLDVQRLMAGYCANPALVVCEVSPREVGLPFTAYLSKDEVREDGTEKSRKVFVSLPIEVGQTEAEEVGASRCAGRPPPPFFWICRRPGVARVCAAPHCRARLPAHFPAAATPCHCCTLAASAAAAPSL